MRPFESKYVTSALLINISCADEFCNKNSTAHLLSFALVKKSMFSIVMNFSSQLSCLICSCQKYAVKAESSLVLVLTGCSQKQLGISYSDRQQ